MRLKPWDEDIEVVPVVTDVMLLREEVADLKQQLAETRRELLGEMRRVEITIEKETR